VDQAVAAPGDRRQGPPRAAARQRRRRRREDPARAARLGAAHRRGRHRRPGRRGARDEDRGGRLSAGLDRTPVSLHTPLGADGEDGELGSLLIDEDAPNPLEYATIVLRDETLGEALDNLPRLERKVLELRYGLDGSGERRANEVARSLGLTVERVRRVEDGALAKLRVLPEAQSLREAA